MLAEFIKQLVENKLSESAGAYYRSKNDFHTAMVKNKKQQMDLESKLDDAKKNATSMVIRGLNTKISNAYSASDKLVDAANTHHGNGMGDAIRDHAYMSLEPQNNGVDTYNLPHNKEFRKIHGIKDDSSLTVAPEKQPTNTTPHKMKPIAQEKPSRKKPEPTLTQKILKGSILSKLFK